MISKHSNVNGIEMDHQQSNILNSDHKLLEHLQSQLNWLINFI
jgi:hypothetical protein